MTDTKNEFVDFPESIVWMNETFMLPVNEKLKSQGVFRLEHFKEVLTKEIAELDDVYVGNGSSIAHTDDMLVVDGVDFVALADVLADIIVYTRSEALRWGIPLELVLKMVMASQESKLDENGQPIMAPDGSKFIKGPNYVPPEKKIREALEHYK